MQKDKLTLLRRELAHVRSSGRLSFYRATARDLAGSACEVAWYHKLEDSLAHQRARQLASCNANCLQSPKTLHTQKNIPFPMQRNLSNQQKRVVFVS